MFLPANGPIDLGHTLESGQTFRWRRDGEAYVGIVGGDVFQVRPAPGGVEFDSAPTPPETAAAVLRSYLRLDDDLEPFYRFAAGDARLAEAAAEYRGLRLTRQDPWECLVAFLISSYSNIKRITKHVEDIAAAFGDPIAGGPFGLEPAFAFPGPAVLAEVSEQEFRRMGLGWRAKFLTRTARAALELPHGLLALRGAPYDEAKDALLSFYGVGEKVADCVLAFSLDQPRAFPVDVWVRRAVREWYFGGESLTDRRVREWAAGYFGDYAAYAQQYLFHRRRLATPA